ncbi:carbohydrate ABC transporter permease [Actinopolymorpha alba]|uniref:carbohydrate ABC transporter permease n=1 Tax=Actinopolymorpha alba TaxID=533267 RepID=UPI000373602A|nr:carbohydrate ABC transporter permease [Actinopolymorpha alba]
MLETVSASRHAAGAGTGGRGSPATTRNRRVRRAARRLLLYAVLLALGWAFVLPMVWMLGASLKPENEVMVVPPDLLPSVPQWANYVAAADAVLPFFWNSAKLALLNVAFLLLFASLAGFGFARLEFRGKNVAFAALLATAMIPGIVYLIPQYIMYRQIGWIDTHYPLWVPKVLTPVFGTFLLRQAFRTIPRELEEAAAIDGASTFTVYWRIMLPQVKPALAAVGVLTFLESWNDLFGPLIFVNSQHLQTLPVALALFQGEYFTQTNLMMAAATISVVPPLVLFVLAQKYFVQGVTMTGLRG